MSKKFINECLNCRKEYDLSDRSYDDYGIKCICGGYIVSPSGKIRGKWKEVRKMDKEKFNQLMYALTKNAARSGFHDFLEVWGITPEEYEKIKKYLIETYGIKPYV